MMKRFTLIWICGLFFSTLQAQKIKANKYPSIFWEITGNGLSKPSYLFGTMHVSDKMVFHLSDSFYIAMRNCDMVALELNPGHWQRDLMKMTEGQLKYTDFYKGSTNNYLTEKSFQPDDYYNNLRAALTSNPQQINGLLYRTQSYEEDYEEDTYLDLYIYQTGRKLGKKAGGVEDYYETQKIILEAYADMAKEKVRKRQDTDGESVPDIEKKIQDAYRRGDLDMLDSLEKYTFNSPAYLEKFLYKRNEIQAHSIDTILKHNSLFVGVGAAHLPGNRGVIELLRKKGYKLRPVFMQDRDAENKETIEKIKVPVSFTEISTDDNLLKMKVPGPFYRMQTGMRFSDNDNWQYADMENGSYYILTRVKTHAGLLGQTQKDVIKKIDSLLYENIPGKIISKTAINKNGYPGYDITNRTRRGDLQRYNILVTPAEILVFKMSGNLDYVNGDEANTFFGSIAIQQQQKGWSNYNAAGGGFSVQLPAQPNILLNTSEPDGIDRWEYEATDSANSDAYAIWVKSVVNHNFLEEDTFDLSLIEQSLKQSDLIEKEESRSLFINNGYQGLKMRFSLKAGGFMNAEALLRGTHYYLLMQRTDSKKEKGDAFFSSFSFKDYVYPAPTRYTDTIVHFSVNTPVKPTLDSALVNMITTVMNDAGVASRYESSGYWPKNKYALFKSDSSGEAVLVTATEFPKYFQSRDSARFWKNQLDIEEEKDLFLQSKTAVKITDSCSGFKLVWRDTNTVRQIVSTALLQNNILYRITALNDTLNTNSAFINEFFKSFTPYQTEAGTSVFTKKTDLFFKDLYSKDSLTKKKARAAIANVYYGPDNINRIHQFINALKYGEEDYFEMKARFISELGYIDDSCCTDSVVRALNDIYTRTADTSYFQNEAIWSLVNLKTKSSYNALKTLLLQDPPVFTDEDDYFSLFEDMEDSLKLAATLFPDILQLATIQDYKEPVNNLLISLLDSGYITAKDYEPYFGKMYFDAKIEMKKQQNIEEKLQEQQIQKENDENAETVDVVRSYSYDYGSSTLIKDYAELLIPFYDTKPGLPKFFDKLLQSRDTSVQLSTAVLLVSNNRKVADSIFLNLAAKDNYRAPLWRRLEKVKHTELFPQKYKTQQLMARSVLLSSGDADDFSEIKQDGQQKVAIKGEKGVVYFYRYKIDKDDEWQMGISGLQPENNKDVSSNDDLTSMTDKKLMLDEPAQEQYEEELKKLIFRQHRSAERFYGDDDYYGYDYDFGN